MRINAVSLYLILFDATSLLRLAVAEPELLRAAGHFAPALERLPLRTRRVCSPLPRTGPVPRREERARARAPQLGAHLCILLRQSGHNWSGLVNYLICFALLSPAFFLCLCSSFSFLLLPFILFFYSPFSSIYVLFFPTSSYSSPSTWDSSPHFTIVKVATIGQDLSVI